MLAEREVSRRGGFCVVLGSRWYFKVAGIIHGHVGLVKAIRTCSIGSGVATLFGCTVRSRFLCLVYIVCISVTARATQAAKAKSDSHRSRSFRKPDTKT